MLRWTLIVGAFATWVAVLGCVMWPTDAPSARAAQELDGEMGPPAPVVQSRDGLPICAVAMQIQRTDWIDKYKHSIDEIAALGADAVLLVVDTRMENGASARIWLDTRFTPTPGQLADLIKHAKSKKLRVILMPIVLLDNPRDDEWRGRIEPRPDPDFGGWDEWFRSYREMITHFSWIAQGEGVDVLVVGSELVSTEPHVEQWRSTIRAVRKIFKGRITYSSNWDHYHAVKFWDELDLIGMNSYWKFGKKDSNEDPSVEEISARWKEIQTDVLKFVREQGKPLLFLEIGWFSQNNVAYEPWDYTKDRPVALELQRKLYEGFFKSWWGNPLLGGFCVWEWPPGDGGPEDTGYTPENKPAERLIREYFAKPRWEVK
jgi:hypothetical protein